MLVLKGWGAENLDYNEFTQGRWNFLESVHFINYLELLATFYALQSLYENERGVHIEIQSNNTSCIKYVNDLEGIVSEDMDLLAKEIEMWQWCLQRNLYFCYLLSRNPE